MRPADYQRNSVSQAYAYQELMSTLFAKGLGVVQDLLAAYGHTEDNPLTFDYDEDETPYTCLSLYEGYPRTECYVTEIYIKNGDVIAKLTSFDDQDGATIENKYFTLNTEYITDWNEIITAILNKKGE